MTFEWYSNDTAKKTITIYPSNITLNTAACSHFQNAAYVLLGINGKTSQIGIKPITKETVNLNIYPKESLHRISLGKSYGRISDRNFILELSEKFNIPLNDKGVKFDAKFNQSDQILIINMKRGE